MLSLQPELIVMNVPLLPGGERISQPPVTTVIPIETKVAVVAALFILGVSESALVASNNILASQNCFISDGIHFMSSAPFLLVPIFAALADGLRGSVVKRQPLFTAGVIIAFLSIGLLGISAYNCTFITAMSVFAYFGVSMTAALALGTLLDRLHRCPLPFAVRAKVFCVAVPMFLGKLISHVFVHFDLCTRTFLIGFSLALLLVMFVTLLVPDVVVLSKSHLALDNTASQCLSLFNFDFAKILLFLMVWKLLPTEDTSLESLYGFNGLSLNDLSKLKFIFYASRIFGAVKLWWLLKTDSFKGYFKGNISRALFFILTAQIILAIVSVIITAQPPPNMVYAAAVHYVTSGVKDGFTFAVALVLGSFVPSEALNSFSSALILSVFTVSTIGSEAIAGSLNSSFSVSNGQAWVAVFICAVLHLVPIIAIRYTIPQNHSSPCAKGVSALEISFEEVILARLPAMSFLFSLCLNIRSMKTNRSILQVAIRIVTNECLFFENKKKRNSLGALRRSKDKQSSACIFPGVYFVSWRLSTESS